MKTNKFHIYAVIILVLIFITGCKASTSTDLADESKITVYTSFYPMYDFAKKIGGDKINLFNLVPAGTEPHDWEPAPKDIATIGKADVLIYNGAGMENWINKIIRSIDTKNIEIGRAHV